MKFNGISRATKSLMCFLMILATVMTIGAFAHPVMAATHSLGVTATVYYPTNNKLEGGAYDMKGKKLNPSNPTIAVSDDLSFLTYGKKVRITIIDKTVKRNNRIYLDKTLEKYNKTYTVRDRLLSKKKHMHVSILVKDAATARAFGGARRAKIEFTN